MITALTYDDVLLVPKYSEISSRKEIDIGIDLDDCIRLELPVIASPMDTICGPEMAAALSRSGGLGVIHRYNSIREQANMVSYARDILQQKQERCLIGAAVGVTGDYMLRTTALVTHGAEVICIDVAHGDHLMMKEALTDLKHEFGNPVHFMAGNVATADAYKRLCDWGADSVRVGIGGGSICSTRIQTGHGVPNIEAIRECALVEYDIPIVADGGIKTSGDAVKALAVGADFVMVGSLLAGTTETPGDIVGIDGVKYKAYRGMASAAAQTEWRGDYSFAEGISTRVPYVGDVDAVLATIKGGVLSGFSYSGARNIQELWLKSEFIRQTGAGQLESSTHILNK